MRPAWAELAKRGAVGRNVMSFAFSSAEAAHKECQRLPTSEEYERIKAVEHALENLRDAIARAPFLDSAHRYGISLANNESAKELTLPPHDI